MSKVKNSTIREAQWVCTYRCKLNSVSNYCSLGAHAQVEAGMSSKREAIENFSEIGVEKLKILGGEFFDLNEAMKLIIALNFANFDYIITTNGVNSQKILALSDTLGRRPGNGLFFSMDFLRDEKSSIGGCSHIKTIKAKEIIPRLVGRVSLLGVNTVIHRGNLDELPQILEWISRRGGYMNICPLIWGKWEKFVYRAPDRDLALKPEDFTRVDEIMNELLKMKKQGYHLACSEEYISQLAEVCCRDQRFGWDCGHLNFCPLLRIDADLSLMICSDVRGAVVPKFKLSDLLEKDNYKNFLIDWLADPDRMHCARNFGCYWSNVVRAADNFQQGGSFVL